jgi:elongation factor Ts
MAISMDSIKALREQTGAGIMDCKKALEDSQGDPEKALQLLRQRGLAQAAKRAERVTSQGVVEAYVHAGGRLASLVELNCETDFVARTDEFRKLAHDLAMQVAAMRPLYVSEADIPPGVEGTLEELCLLRQPFIKDPSRTVQELISDVVARTGENIRVRRFKRLELGGED